MAGAIALPGLAQAAPVLRVLAWPGYADDDLVKAFERRASCQVELSVIDSDEALWSRLHHPEAGGFDVFAVNTAELQRYIRAGLVADLATDRIPGLATQLPRFRNRASIPGLMHGGRCYAIPYTYSEMGLIRDRAQVPVAPVSIAALWDPTWRGRVIAYDGGTHNFSLAAQVLSLPSPFSIEKAAWPRAVERLIALRRNVAGFYVEPEESVALFRRRRAALMFANYGSQQLKLLRAAGVDADYSLPREGALAWLDCWAITRGCSHPALALAWIDHLLSPAAGKALMDRQGLACTTVEQAERPGGPLRWLEPVESEERRALLWRRIMSGDRLDRVIDA